MKMDDSQVFIHSPQDGQSLEQYIQSFTDSQLKQIKRSPESLKKLSTFLIDIFKKTEKVEDNLEKFWSIIKEANNLDGLLRIIRNWERARLSLIESLAENEKEILENSNLTNLGKFACSTIDIAGTVGSELMRDTQPGYAKFAVAAATLFGIIGCMAPGLEKKALERKLEELLNLIKEDQELFEPIKIWYDETPEIQASLKKIFKIDITSGIGSELYKIVKRFDDDSTPVNVLTECISSLDDDDIKSLKNKDILRTFVNLSKHKEFRELIKWMYHQRRLLTFEAVKVLLQFQYTPIRELLREYIPVLGIGEKQASVLFWGHIAVNAVTIFQSIHSLWKPKTPKIISDMRRLRKDLKSEAVSLQRLADFVELRMRSEE